MFIEYRLMMLCPASSWEPASANVTLHQGFHHSCKSWVETGFHRGCFMAQRLPFHSAGGTPLNTLCVTVVRLTIQIDE